MRRGPLSEQGLQLGVKELRTELYRALPITASRATKVFYGETTKRVTDASVFTARRSHKKNLMGLRVKRCEPARFDVPGWWTRYSSSMVVRPPRTAVPNRQWQSTPPTEHKVNRWNMGTPTDRSGLGTRASRARPVRISCWGRSLRSSPRTGKPCTWRRQAGNRRGLR